jgi:hypothetical protein
MSVSHRVASPSCTQPLPTGPRCHRSHPSAARIIPPATVVRQRRRPLPPTGGRCWPLEPFSVVLGPPLSSPFYPPCVARINAPPLRCVPTAAVAAHFSAISTPNPPSHHSDAPTNSPLLLLTTRDRLEHPDRFPLGKLDRRATVSPISGEDNRPHASLHVSPIQLKPHLPLPLTGLQVDVGVFPALESRPPL